MSVQAFPNRWVPVRFTAANLFDGTQRVLSCLRSEELNLMSITAGIEHGEASCTLMLDRSGSDLKTIEAALSLALRAGWISSATLDQRSLQRAA